MELPANTTHLLLTRAVSLEVVDERVGSVAVPAELSYDQSDPFAVTLSIGGDDSAVAWTFARELVSEGLHEPTGDGDVHVWPCLDEHGCAILLIELSVIDGEVMLQADPREIKSFLATTYDAVAPDQESAHLDIDAVISAILAAEPRP